MIDKDEEILRLTEENTRLRIELKSLLEKEDADLALLSLTWVAGDHEAEWEKEFFAWYKPENWLHIGRAINTFLAKKVQELDETIFSLETEIHRCKEMNRLLQEERSGLLKSSNTCPSCGLLLPNHEKWCGSPETHIKELEGRLRNIRTFIGRLSNDS